MKKLAFYLFATTLLTLSCKENTKKNEAMTSKTTEAMTNKAPAKTFDFTPITHATMVMNYGNTSFYVDPTGGKEAFANFKYPDYVIITDIHGDHLDTKTLDSLALDESKIIAPQAVFDKLPENLQSKTTVMNNGDTKTFDDFTIEAIPMYNLREEALKFHTKGRGNGYVITFGDERIYISGDTEDISEMRNLKDIDKAFVCMNLPYTMTVESAASAVLDFKPKTVYPYHYRGTEGLSDVEKFKSIVNEGNPDIKVVQLDWYPKQ